MLIRRIVIGLVLALLVALPAMAQDYKVGEAAYVKGDYVNAYKVWAPLATSGIDRAQYGVGTWY